MIICYNKKRQTPNFWEKDVTLPDLSPSVPVAVIIYGALALFFARKFYNSPSTEQNAPKQGVRSHLVTSTIDGCRTAALALVLLYALVFLLDWVLKHAIAFISGAFR